jgi:Domain of unknown function (DUF4123)
VLAPEGGRRIDETGLPVFMLVDAARDPAIYARLVALGDTLQARSMYQGDLGENLAHVSPYLLAIRGENDPGAWFATAGLGQSWGVFVIAKVGLNDLRRHLRKFNLVYTEAGTSLVFRYYDPRVLGIFLPTCNAGELKRFFGPVDSFLAETVDGESLARFSLVDGQLRTSMIPILERSSDRA